MSRTHKAKFLCFSGQDSSRHKRKENDDISERHSDHRRSKVTSVKLYLLHWLQKRYTEIIALIYSCQVRRFQWKESGPLCVRPALLTHRAVPGFRDQWMGTVGGSQVCKVMDGMGKMNREWLSSLLSAKTYKPTNVTADRFKTNNRWRFFTQSWTLPQEVSL